MTLGLHAHPFPRWLPTRPATTAGKLLELRLEGTRRPEVRNALAAAISDAITGNIDFHAHGRYPGGRRSAIALYLAMSGLNTEHLTLPEAWQETGFARIIDDLVDTVLPEPSEPE